MTSARLSGQHYNFHTDETGVCTIEALGKMSASVAAAITQNAMTHVVQHGLPVGLLIDVRHNDLLSIVRLSNLLDTLTGLGVPVAVVFRNGDQKNLASLLHNTLTQKDRVAYFTELDRATAYLRYGTAQNATMG